MFFFYNHHFSQLGFIHKLKSYSHLVRAHEVLLRRFDLSGYIIGFHLQTQKLETPCTV